MKKVTRLSAISSILIFSSFGSLVVHARPTPLGASSPTAPGPLGKSAWKSTLKKETESLSHEGDGKIGVFVKRLNDGAVFSLAADEKWYLASTTKILVAIAVFLEVEAKRLTLERQLILQESDYVDGAGLLLAKKPGEKFSVRELIRLMLVESDSTATDILIRLVTPERINSLVKERMSARGFGPLTTILQVRYDAYSELHPRARELTNRDFISFKSTPVEKRHEAFAKRLGLRLDELRVSTLKEAFERYYAKGLNSGTLQAFGDLLEKMAKGQLLDHENTASLMDTLAQVKTGEKRVKDGLPTNVTFAHKTGTQVSRICNVGIVGPGTSRALVVASCVREFEDQESAESMLGHLGRALAKVEAF